MSSGWQRMLPCVIVAVTWVVLAPPVAAQARESLIVTVLISDHAGVSRPVVDDAKRVAARIYHQIGIETTWWDTSSLKFEQAIAVDPEAQPAFLKSAITVHLLPARLATPLHAPPPVLGLADFGSNAVVVLYDRVERLSQVSRNMGRLLGEVIAHEMGHLLLATRSHSMSGLMRGELDLEAAGHGNLWLSLTQGELIRTNVSSAHFGSSIREQ